MKNNAANTVDKFFRKYPLKAFQKGNILIYAGSDPESIIYLIKGQVRQYDVNHKGEEVVVNVFKPPAFFPMNWVINKIPNKYFYQAYSSVEAKVAPTEEVREFIQGNPDVVFDLLKRVYRGAEGMQRRMAHLMGGNSRNRVIYELLLECDRFGIEKQGTDCTLDIREDELANRAGLARETVNRQLSELKKEGYVEVITKGVKVYNISKLRKELGSEL